MRGTELLALKFQSHSRERCQTDDQQTGLGVVSEVEKVEEGRGVDQEAQPQLGPPEICSEAW